MTRGAFRLAYAAAFVCSWSSPLSGQEVQVRQLTGLYRPTRISIQNGVLNLRQKIGVTLGARMTLTFNPRFDVVTGVTYIPAYAILRAAGKQVDLSAGSHLLSATIGARYWLLPAARVLSWEVHSGIGVVSGGEQYKDLFEGSTISGNLGTMLRYQVGRIVSLQVRIQQRLYRLYLGGEDQGSSSRPLRLSFGVGFPFLQSALQHPVDGGERAARASW